MNICMVGYGMMGVWHSDGLKEADCCLHTIVGRRPEPTREFASRYGYLKSTIDFSEALSDPEIDAVILAIPSELHMEYALAAVSAGKHTLVEIPIAMNFADSERVVAAAKESGLTLGVVHPLRARREMADLKERVLAGEEEVREELRALEYSQRLRDHSRAALAAPPQSTGRHLFELVNQGAAIAAGRNSGPTRTNLNLH